MTRSYYRISGSGLAGGRGVHSVNPYAINKAEPFRFILGTAVILGFVLSALIFARINGQNRAEDSAAPRFPRNTVVMHGTYSGNFRALP